jgi:hypothetical protein
MIAVLLLLLSTSARERHIKKSDLPASVQKAVEEQAKSGKVLGYSTEVEGGQREYEVETIVNGNSRDITFAPDGNVLELEQQVDIDDLAAEVREGLKAKRGSGTITKVESLTKRGKLVAYEAKVRKAAKSHEIQVGPDGKSLARPE